MKRILLTGITGAVGKDVMEYLFLQKNYDIIGTSRRYTDKGQYKNFFQFFKFDISKREDIPELCREIGTVDAVIHMAANISNDNFDQLQIPTNCSGILNCIELALALKASRFIFLSSIRVIGKPCVLPITEEHATNPLTLHHATKLFCEKIVLLPQYANLNPIILRIPSPVGTVINKNNIVAQFMRRALLNEDIIIYGRGMREQNYIDTRDIARAVNISLNTCATGIYNIASGESIKNIELAHICKEIADSDSRIIFSDKEDPEEFDKWQISIDKASNILGFFPKYNICDTLRDVYLYQ